MKNTLHTALYAILLLTGACLSVPSAHAQRVGLVMSGGGAKGMTHIGVIKALEENGIPIDYVAGTSMGAIVAGLYANGMTTDEMIELIKSDDFHRWQTGEIESVNRYFFRQADPTPELYGITLSESDSRRRLKLNILPDAIVNPSKMNIALLQLFSEAGAVCRGDFDRLFVPFRSVASDVGGQQAYIWRTGDFGDAVRSSMSYPVMFRPVTTDDGHVLMDGGMFNNFPVDVMQADFHPDYIIGSSVSGNSSDTDDRDLMSIAQNLVIRPTDYHIDAEQGIMLQFRWDKINIWDFSIVDQLVRQGYDSTMAHIDEIRARVQRSVSQDEVMQRRLMFNSRKPRLLFKRVKISGVDTDQQQYIEQIFHHGDEVFDMQQMQERYYKLLSDEIIPHAVIDPQTGYYDLLLDIKTADRLRIMVGGNLSTTIANQMYIGARYQQLTRTKLQAGVDLQVGQFYNSFGAGARWDVNDHLYIRPEIVLHNFRHKNDNMSILDNLNNDFITNLNSTEAYARLMVGMPTGMRNR